MHDCFFRLSCIQRNLGFKLGGVTAFSKSGGWRGLLLRLPPLVRALRLRLWSSAGAAGAYSIWPPLLWVLLLLALLLGWLSLLGSSLLLWVAWLSLPRLTLLGLLGSWWRSLLLAATLLAATLLATLLLGGLLLWSSLLLLRLGSGLALLLLGASPPALRCLLAWLLLG